MIDICLVAIGGFGGAILRAFVSRKLNHVFPLIYSGTLVVNVAGSLMFGFLLNIQLYTSMNLLLGMGFLGSFTTLSTLKIESITLLQTNRRKQFIVYSLLTYTIGIIFAFIGFWLAQQLEL